MPYIGTTPTKVVSRQSANVYRYTATAGQSVFTGADLDNNILACNPADMIVHMNGLRLESTDYTATSTSVTLTTAATAGDEVTVTSFVTFEIADTYTKTAADSRYVNTTGDTMTGQLTVSAADTNDIIKLSRTGTSAGSGYIYSNQNETFGVHNGAGAYQLMVDSAGRVTTPYQPAFNAIKANSNSYPAMTALQWTEISDIGNNFNGVRFTAPVSGFYHFEFGGVTQNVTNYLYLGFLINGSNANGTPAGSSWRHLNQVTGNYDNMHTSLSVYLSANDYVEAATGYNGGAPYLEQYRSSFSGYLIG